MIPRTPLQPGGLTTAAAPSCCRAEYIMPCVNILVPKFAPVTPHSFFGKVLEEWGRLVKHQIPLQTTGSSSKKQKSLYKVLVINPKQILLGLWELMTHRCRIWVDDWLVKTLKINLKTRLKVWGRGYHVQWTCAINPVLTSIRQCMHACIVCHGGMIQMMILYVQVILYGFVDCMRDLTKHRQLVLHFHFS